MQDSQLGGLQNVLSVDDENLPVALPDRLASAGRPITTSAQWCDYFERNAACEPPIPWEIGADASPEELARIVPSLRAWQLGETSDGRHLIEAAGRYARRVNDPEFLGAVRYFIREEQHHGECLGRFLDLAGAERATSDWGDSLFRSARYLLPSMEVWATPVVMVETHAMVYYNALRRATGSRVLQAICRQILADEVPHIRFQCERLAILHHRRPLWLLFLTHLGQIVLFTMITLAIWIGHRRALRAGGYTFSRFWRTTWGRMAYAWRMMDPSRYRFEFPNSEFPKSESIPNVQMTK